MTDKNTGNIGMRVTDEDRSKLASAKRILENENKGIRFSVSAILRAALYFFVESKEKSVKPTPK